MDSVPTLPGYALTTTAYIVTWLTAGRPSGAGPVAGDHVRGLYELVRKRLDDDDQLGASYVESSPRSLKAHRVLTDDIEQAARHHPQFEATLRAAVDHLRQAGAADHLAANGGAAVVHRVAAADRRGAEVFRPGLAAAVGAAADAMLGPAGAAEAAAAAADRQGPTPFQILYYAAALVTAAGLLTSVVAAAAFGSRAGILAGIVMMVLGAPTAGILHRLPRLRGV